jgi:hypothetical protein
MTLHVLRFYPLACQSDRIHDMLVAGTAAEIAGNGLADLPFCGIGIVLEEGDERHEKTGGAETTLHAMRFAECLLKGVQLIGRSQPFDSHHLVAVRLDGEHQA